VRGALLARLLVCFFERKGRVMSLWSGLKLIAEAARSRTSWRSMRQCQTDVLRVLTAEEVVVLSSLVLSWRYLQPRRE
jgi:hypothetical protein